MSFGNTRLALVASTSSRKGSVMSIHPMLAKVTSQLQRTDLPVFKPGDQVRVHVKIKEGDKERVQAFEGIIIKHKKGPEGTFTVRKMSFGQGVERIFPLNSKVVDRVEVLRSHKVRRARLFFLRELRGKAARLKEVDERQSKKKAAVNA